MRYLPRIEGRPRLILGTLRAFARQPQVMSTRAARRGFFRLAGHFTATLSVQRADGPLLLHTADRVVSLVEFVRGPWDAEGLERALEELARRGMRLNDRTVVEIGANIGTHTRALVAQGAERVVAIEPAPDNFALLRANVALAGIGERVDLRQVALSSSRATLALELSAHNHGDHRIQVSQAPLPGRRTVPVQAIPFDDLVESGVVDLDATGLVWIDTQGHEAEVLAGASRLLQSRVPIVLEYWPDGLRRAGGWDQLRTLLATHRPLLIDLGTHGGGRPQVITPDALPDLERLRGWDSGAISVDDRYTDLLALPAPL